MKTTAYLLGLHSFETRLRNHGSFPNITPCVLLLSTVVGAMSSMTLVARFNLAPDLSNRGGEKRMNKIKKKEKKKRKRDNLGDLHFKCRNLFRRLHLDLTRDGISFLSNYLGFA